ncbi:MAG: FkbM family methyltransferase [Dehalococcoidia bacterium]
MRKVEQGRRRLLSGAHKLHWGARVVGVRVTAAGVVRYAWVRLRRPSSIEVRLSSGGSLITDVPGQLVPALVVFGDLIDPEYPLLRRLAAPEWVVVDVGAAIGQFTVFAARLGVRAVHACEPSDSNLASLRRNLEQNGVADRVDVHRLALSNTTGEARFATAATTYMSRLDRAASSNGQDDPLVPVRLLSDVAATWHLDRIDVLKVNVAGFEPRVLEGADALFAAGAVDIVIALIGGPSLDCYRRMAGFGYRFFFFDPRQDLLHEVVRIDDRLLEWRPSPARHVIAIHRNALARNVHGGLRIVPGPA